MEIGTRVKAMSFPEKGTGLVVGRQEVFDQVFVEVIFEKTREKMSFAQEDLSKLFAPNDNIKQGMYSKAETFMLRLLKEQIKELTSSEGFHTAAGFKILPLPHQLLAVSFVLDQFKPRALIADEVGLGKTIEAALIYEELKARGLASNILIIAPSGLCEQWREEMNLKFFEEFIIYDKETVHYLKNFHGEETNVWKLNNKIITSIDFIKPKRINEELDERTIKNRLWHNSNVHEAAVQAGFDVVIFDEAHKLTKDASGDETARYKIGKALAEAVPVLLLLTATPHQGDSAKFKNLLGLIDPYLFYKNSDLTPENVQKVTVRNNKRAAVDFSGNRLFKQRITSLYSIERKEEQDQPELALYSAVTDYVSQFYNMAREQNNRTMMFLLLIYQRMVSSSSRAVLKSLSNRLEALLSLKQGLLKIEQEVMADNITNVEELAELPAEEQLRLLEKHFDVTSYLENKKYLELEITELKKCVSLAQKSAMGRNDAKFQRLLEVIDEFKSRENNPELKFIIFTEFVETQSYINDCLIALGYKTALINGRMSVEEKLVQKRRFQEEAQFLISTDAGGEGINLQFCWVMVNYDLPWNPMRLEQRIGRIDRIGQQHNVKIINFQLKDTVEQYVRDVIEGKLEVIQKEFNDGEDKLADILSTLNDEFSFDKIFIDAVISKERDSVALEELAQQIYKKAQEIIREGQLVLPFSEFDQKVSLNEADLVKQSQKALNLLEAYLLLNGKGLLQYKSKPGVYYFEDPVTGKRISNVIFDQKNALENEDYELISLSHPYLAQILSLLNNDLEGQTAAKLQINEPRFNGEKGYLFVYKMEINNYIDRPQEHLLYSFINQNGQVNNRISKYFKESEKLDASDLISGNPDFNLEVIEKAAQKDIGQKAEVIFYEHKLELEEKVREIKEQMEKYFLDKKLAIERIAVDNIRIAKLKELTQDREAKYAELDRKTKLIPLLCCEQIAYVEFC